MREADPIECPLETITSTSQLVMELPGVDDEPLAYFHADCFQVWETLRRLTVG